VQQSCTGADNIKFVKRTAFYAAILFAASACSDGEKYTQEAISAPSPFHGIHAITGKILAGSIVVSEYARGALVRVAADDWNNRTDIATSLHPHRGRYRKERRCLLFLGH
jgi:hypothetical protein